MLAILTVLKELILRGKETQKKLSAKKRFLTESILCVSAALSPAASNFKVNAERKSKVDDNTAKMQSIKWLGV